MRRRRIELATPLSSNGRATVYAIISIILFFCLTVAFVVTQVVTHNKTSNLEQSLDSLGFDDLSDVLNGSVLTYNGTFWIPQTPGDGNFTLDNLSNVETGMAMNNSYLIYNGSTWVATIPDIDVIDMLGGLLDVTLTTPQLSEVLIHTNNGEWVNGMIKAASVDKMEVQLRILGICPAQSYIRRIFENGTVVCDNSVANNVIGSSQIIDNSVTDEDIDSTVVQERVFEQCLGDGNYVKQINQDGTVVCSVVLAPMSVGTAQIQDGSVTNTDIDSSSVQERIDGFCSAVGESIIAIASDGSVTCSNAVANNVIGPTQLQFGAVTAAKISTGAVTSDSILDGTITAVDMSTSYQIGVPNGIVPLNSNGVINQSFLPAIAITNVVVCGNIACRDMVSPINTGDVVKVIDSDGAGNPNTYIWDGTAFQSITNSPNNLSLNDLLDVSIATTPTNGQVLTFDTIDLMWKASNAIMETATNLGVGGLGFFAGKTGTEFQFYSIAAGASNTIVLSGPSNGNIMVDVDTTTIDHNSLVNVSSNAHVDHSAVFLSGSNGISIDGGVSADISISRTITLNASLANLNDVDNMLSPSDEQIIQFDASMNTWKAADKVCATNSGTQPGHVFIAKVNNTLQFRQIGPLDSKISVTNSMNDVLIGIQQGSVDHDALLNYVSTEHMDHAQVNIGVTNGLMIDGGITPKDITASRTLSIDLSAVQARVSGTCASGSFIQQIDQNGNVSCGVAVQGPTSATDNAIVRFDGTSGLALQDSLITISDTGAISGATSYNGVAIDSVMIVGGIGLKNTGSSTLESSVQIDLDVGSLPDLSAGLVDFNNDRLLVYDASSSMHYKMPFSDLPLFEKPPIGEIYYFDLGGTASTITTSAVTTNGLNNLIEVLPTGGIVSPGARGFAIGTGFQLKYLGTPDVYCHTATTISVSAGNNIDLVAALGITDGGGTTIQANSRVEFRVSSSIIESTAIHAYVPMSTNDDMSLFVGSVSGTTTIKIHSVNLFAMCMIVS